MNCHRTAGCSVNAQLDFRYLAYDNHHDDDHYRRAASAPDDNGQSLARKRTKRLQQLPAAEATTLGTTATICTLKISFH